MSPKRKERRAKGQRATQGVAGNLPIEICSHSLLRQAYHQSLSEVELLSVSGCLDRRSEGLRPPLPDLVPGQRLRMSVESTRPAIQCG